MLQIRTYSKRSYINTVNLNENPGNTSTAISGTISGQRDPPKARFKVRVR